MRKDKAMKWVKALRSGKYKQDSDAGVLRTEDGKFCCLGVLADISRGGIKSGSEPFLNDYDNNCGLISEEGFPFNNNGAAVKIEHGYREYDTLADMNDAGVSFKEIAKWIEKNYKLL